MEMNQTERFCFFMMLFLLSSIAAGERITCTVTVVDIQANPVPGAEVVVYEKETDRLIGKELPRFLCTQTKTNQNGQVTLDLDCKRARQVMIVAHKAGYALGWDVLPYRNDSNPNINIILDKPVLLSGQIVNDKDRPVADASVQAQPKIGKMRRLEQTPVIGPTKWMTVRTDNNGRFQFNCFGEDVRSDFLVTAATSKTIFKFTPHRTSSCGYEVSREDICLTLPKQVAVRGQVVDDKGHGLADMTVVIKRDHRNRDNYYKNNYVPMRCKTDEDGRFYFEGLLEASHFLSVLNTDLSKPWVDKTIIFNAADSGARSNVMIQLERGGIMEVTMLDESSQKPIEDMFLMFSQEPANENQWWFRRDLKTGPDGKAKAILPAGKCNFRFWDERYERTELKLPIVEKGKPAAVNFKLMPNKPVVGVVKNLDGKPAADVSVNMTWGQTVLTDSKGAFKCTYDSLREGMCLIARDIKNNQAALSQIGDPEESAILILKPVQTLTGTIVDVKGNPIPAARVSVDFDGPGYLSDCCPEIVTDKTGQFSVKAIPTDIPDDFSFRISVRTMNHGVLTYKKLQIQEETNDRIELKPIQMPLANQALDGFVLGADENPIVSLPIFLNGDGQYHQTTFTDNKGRFRLRRLCEGEVSLQAGIGGEDFKPGRVTAHSGDTDVKIIMGQSRVHTPEVSLTGQSVPDWKSIGLNPDTADLGSKPLLICFWDFSQRPSRHVVGQLASMKEKIEMHDAELILVHSAPMEEKAKEWLSKKETSFRVCGIPKDSEAVRAKWGVQSLPWLILTDGEHKVIAEGFSVEELESKLSKTH